jgi:hypothetical protein
MRFLVCRCAGAVLLIASTGSHAVAGDPAAEPGVPRTDMHKVLLSEFRYVETPRDPAPNAPILSKTGTGEHIAAPTPDNSAPIMMAPFTVQEDTRMDALHADLATQKATARTAKITSRLGIGVHTGPMGFYAITVFYIPITVGIGTPIVKPK